MGSKKVSRKSQQFITGKSVGTDQLGAMQVVVIIDKRGECSLLQAAEKAHHTEIHIVLSNVLPEVRIQVGCIVPRKVYPKLSPELIPRQTRCGAQSPHGEYMVARSGVLRRQ